jgi:hypothetical protein
VLARSQVAVPLGAKLERAPCRGARGRRFLGAVYEQFRRTRSGGLRACDPAGLVKGDVAVAQGDVELSGRVEHLAGGDHSLGLAHGRARRPRDLGGVVHLARQSGGAVARQLLDARVGRQQPACGGPGEDLRLEVGVGLLRSAMACSMRARLMPRVRRRGPRSRDRRAPMYRVGSTRPHRG